MVICYLTPLSIHSSPNVGSYFSPYTPFLSFFFPTSDSPCHPLLLLIFLFFYIQLRSACWKKFSTTIKWNTLDDRGKFLSVPLGCITLTEDDAFHWEFLLVTYSPAGQVELWRPDVSLLRVTGRSCSTWLRGGEVHIAFLSMKWNLVCGVFFGDLWPREGNFKLGKTICTSPPCNQTEHEGKIMYTSRNSWKFASWIVSCHFELLLSLLELFFIASTSQFQFAKRFRRIHDH